MQKYILHADDNEHDLLFTTRALELCLVEAPIHVARDGEEAVLMLRDKRKPQLIILDLKMPKVDGFTIIKLIRSTPALSTIPIIVVSNSILEADRIRAMSLGANNYIVKHMEFTEFAKMISIALSPYISSLQKEDSTEPIHRRKSDSKPPAKAKY